MKSSEKKEPGKGTGIIYIPAWLHTFSGLGERKWLNSTAVEILRLKGRFQLLFKEGSASKWNPFGILSG